MHRYKELIVWRKSIEVVKQVYMLTEKFPQTEKFGLSLQIRRSAVSIPSNIAEGAGKRTNVDFKRFISIANGSCNELETQLFLSEELKYITPAEYSRINCEINEIQNMLFSLQKSLLYTLY
jgi:four helix bundle protein